MTDEAQALCFLAGANSIFAGERLLTQRNNGACRDHALMAKLGMRFLEVAERPREGFFAAGCEGRGNKGIRK
jgi:biotin synthase